MCHISIVLIIQGSWSGTVYRRSLDLFIPREHTGKAEADQRLGRCGWYCECVIPWGWKLVHMSLSLQGPSKEALDQLSVQCALCGYW